MTTATTKTRRSGKRGNGEGTIRQRPKGLWEARVALEGGKRKSLYGKTRQEAAAKLAAYTRDRDRGLPVATDERQTTATFVAGWLERTKSAVRPSTFRRYRELLTIHAVPVLGKAPLARLTPTQVESLYAALLEYGLAPATVRQLHAILHHVLKDALRKGIVQRNVCDLVTTPRVPRHEIRPLTPEEADKVLRAAVGVRLEALYVLALTTGMRQGELLGLRWRDVDLEAEVLSVRVTLQKVAGRYTLAEPKTTRGRRRIPLVPEAVAALRAHRARQSEERLRVGQAWRGLDLVFCDETGEPLNGISVLRYSFYPLLKRAGVEKVRFHDLRHTTATLLLREGVHPKIVAELLGHATISITLDTYSHVLPDMMRRATAAMSRALYPRQASSK
jgi:integrase